MHALFVCGSPSGFIPVLIQNYVECKPQRYSQNLCIFICHVFSPGKIMVWGRQKHQLNIHQERESLKHYW